MVGWISIASGRSHRNPDHVWNADEDLTFLKNMGGYAIDRNTGKGWLTAAGLLMFGKGLSVREGAQREAFYL